MKSLLYKLSALMSILGLVSVLSCSAQITTKVSFTVNSPFVVEKTTLPPGAYTIRPFADDPDVYELSSSTGHAVIFNCETSGEATKNELTFHRYGSLLYLKQVAAGGNVCFVPAGPAEKQAKKTGKPTKETVATS